MAKRKANRGNSTYAKPVTVGNGTLSYEMDANSTEKTVTVFDVLTGTGILPPIAVNSSVEGANKGVVARVTGSGSSSTVTWPTGFMVPAGDYYMIPVASYFSRVDAVKVSSVTTGPNAGTRLPVEINFLDGQLFRCDNAMKPTKVKPSAKSPAGLWHDSTDLNFPLFTVKGSNTANPVRVGVAIRQF